MTITEMIAALEKIRDGYRDVEVLARDVDGKLQTVSLETFHIQRTVTGNTYLAFNV